VSQPADGPVSRDPAASASSASPDASVKVRIGYDRGLHARPASVVAERARQYACDIEVVMLEAPEGTSTPPGTRADAKNILDLMFLGAPCGTELAIEARGPDAHPAVEALRRLFEAGFGI
jgi:phosphocarrier protein NPr